MTPAKRWPILALATLCLASSCEQITGVKPPAVPCTRPDTLNSAKNGLFRYQSPKLGCLIK